MSSGFRDHQQFISSISVDVVLQWDGVHLRRGLVIVNNIISIKPDGPSTGPIILRDIRFPGSVPPINAEQPRVDGNHIAPDSRISASAIGTTTPRPRVVDAATNSGVLVQNQFSDGGFCDVGMQWRHLKVHGPVTVVHNSLSVEVIGSDTGPITVSDVLFNSGAFFGGPATAADRQIISPPRFLSRRPRFRRDFFSPLPRDHAIVDATTNSGILLGGQFASGGLGHIALQWRKVGIPGPVTIIDNVLSVKTSGARTSPITIEHVTFA